MQPHRFHEGERSRLLSEERMKLQSPNDIIGRSDLKNGDVVADLGCGNGFLTLPLSRLGMRVIAIDAQKGMLDDLMAHSGHEDARICPIVAELPGIPLRDGSVDHIFMLNFFHELADRKGLVCECRRVLRPGGRLTLVDFQKRPTVMGPPLEERIAEEDVERELSGFRVERRTSLPEYYQFEFVISP